MPLNNKHHQRTKERGNVFIFILMGIILFASLSFVISRGLRSDTTSNLSDQQVALAASDILNYAQRIERAVNKIRRNSISENDISLEYDGNYVNNNCNDGADPEFPGCQVFNGSGGRVDYISPDDNVTTSEWHFTGATCIADLGTGATGCDSDGNTTNEELLLVLTDLSDAVCTEINDRLNITAIPADAGGGASTSAFTGSFSNGTEITLAGGPFSSACFSRSGRNDFYFTLIER